MKLPNLDNQQRLSRKQVDQLADEIATAAAHIDAATHRLLTSIRKFDECSGWSRQGARTCAYWLSYRIGLGVNAAREKVRVARRLGELPLIDAALKAGKLSFSKVRAMTRVATADNEARLVRTAECATGAQLERICRGYRQVTEGKKPRLDDERRYVRKRYTRSGMVRIEAQLRPDEAELVMQALRQMRSAARGEDEPALGTKSRRKYVTAEAPPDAEAERAGQPIAGPSALATKSQRKNVTAEASPEVEGEHARQPTTAPPDLTTKSQRKNVTAETSPDPDEDTPTPNLADGLLLMAESALTRGPTTRRAGERTQLIVQLGEDRLDTGDRGTCRGDERPGARVGTPNRERSEPWRAVLHDGTWLSGQTFQRLACDCGLTIVKTATDGTPLDVGRKRRTIPPALWTALLSRDQGQCQFPGCTCRVFLEAHHIEHWSQGGPTNLANLTLVCASCHQRLHEGGFHVERQPDGTLRFYTPDGDRIDPCPPPAAVEGDGLSLVMAENEARDLGIDARTSLPHNYTPRFDLGGVVSSLLPNHGRI